MLAYANHRTSTHRVTLLFMRLTRKRRCGLCLSLQFSQKMFQYPYINPSKITLLKDAGIKMNLTLFNWLNQMVIRIVQNKAQLKESNLVPYLSSQSKIEICQISTTNLKFLLQFVATGLQLYTKLSIHHKPRFLEQLLLKSSYTVFFPILSCFLASFLDPI